MKQLVVVPRNRLGRHRPSEKIALFNEDGSPYVSSSSLEVDAAGAPVVRAFPITFDDPNILTGVEIFTPTVGDILLDAWLEVDEAWDGTTPTGNIGFTSPYGLLYAQSMYDMSIKDLDVEEWFNTGLEGSHGILGANAGVHNITLARLINGQTQRIAPAKFISDDPLKFWVTQDGLRDGAEGGGGVSPGSTQGSAILYVVTATPTGNVSNGLPVTHKFDIDFDTPSILNGVELMSLKPGQIIAQAWIIINTAFNGSEVHLFTGSVAHPTDIDGWNLTGVSADEGTAEFLYRQVQINNDSYVVLDDITLVAKIDSDGEGGDPGNTQGSLSLFVTIIDPVQH